MSWSNTDKTLIEQMLKIAGLPTEEEELRKVFNNAQGLNLHHGFEFDHKKAYVNLLSQILANLYHE